MLYYLNDNYTGGQTAFPFADNKTLDMLVSISKLLLKCLYHVWEFYIFVISLDFPEKNCNISCPPNILSSWTFSFSK